MRPGVGDASVLAMRKNRNAKAAGAKSAKARCFELFVRQVSGFDVSSAPGDAVLKHPRRRACFQSRCTSCPNSPRSPPKPGQGEARPERLVVVPPGELLPTPSSFAHRRRPMRSSARGPVIRTLQRDDSRTRSPSAGPRAAPKSARAWGRLSPNVADPFAASRADQRSPSELPQR